MTQARAVERQVGNELAEALADDEAFRRWYDRAMPRVYAYLVSRLGGAVDLAEELTQQAFIAAIDERHRFDGRSDSVTWLIAIARHKLADHFRRLEREGRRFLRVQVAETSAFDDAPTWRAADERDTIVRVLASLPPLQRAALLFVTLDGLTVREAGRLIGRSEGATQSLVNRARESFRARYRREVGDD